MTKKYRFKKFKVQLKKNQVITLSSLDHIELWRLRYPQLKILEITSHSTL